MDEDYSLSLLNLFEVEDDSGPRHLVCFQEAVLAGTKGIDHRAIVGEFTPDGDGEFDPTTFALNGDFIDAFVAYMNAEAVRSEALLSQAMANPGGWLYLIDPRNQEPGGEPPPTDLLGAFQIDDAGTIVPLSFRYNPSHAMFDPQSGPSGILIDRRFYIWLHPEAAPAAGTEPSTE